MSTKYICKSIEKLLRHIFIVYICYVYEAFCHRAGLIRILQGYNMEGWASNLAGRLIRISFFRFLGEPLGDYYLGRGPFIG